MALGYQCPLPRKKTGAKKPKSRPKASTSVLLQIQDPLRLHGRCALKYLVWAVAKDIS